MYPRCATITTIALLAFCLCAVSSRNVENARQKRNAENSCDNVRSFFQSRDIPHEQDGVKGKICGGQCCGPDAEAVLRKQGQEVFATMLRHNSRSLQGLLNTTATVFQGHISELAHQSENKTLVLFSQVYRRMSVLSSDAVNGLYSDIRRYVQINGLHDTFSTTNIDIVSSVTRFFTDLFPLVYHHILEVVKKDFSADYKLCLKERISEVQPFGDIPRQVGQSLSKSMDAARLLLQALGVGLEVLNVTDELVLEDNGKTNVECHDALMKMTYCPKCNGLKEDTKPCSGYCLNVLRGCLTRYVSELDSPWNGYVEGMERLVTAVKQHNNEAGVNADAVVRGLDTRISEAIMHAMERKHEIEMKVKRVCGSFTLSDREEPHLVDADSTVESVLASKQRLTSRQFNPLPQEISDFLNIIGKSRGFYSNLADNLCQDESFAETKDEHCWNGERIGEYTKTVVDIGLNMQKYNPEVKPSAGLQSIDSRVANLADKLRHVHQMVMTSLAGVGLPESDNYMQGDGADGSGSGAGNDDDDDTMRGSGSGDGPDVTYPGEGGGNDSVIVPGKGPDGQETSISTRAYASWSITVIALALTKIILCFS